MPTPSAATEIQLRQAEERLTVAERTGDAAALLGLLALDFSGHDTAGRPTTRESFIAAFTAPTLRFEHLEIDEVTYRVEGATGVVCGRSSWRVQVPGRMVTGTGRYLDVWQWRDQRWQLIAAAVTPQIG